MKFKELKNNIKEEQKQLAKDITKKKEQLKKTQRACKDASGYQWDVCDMKSRYRYTHVAYCMFFNKTPYDKIEKPRKNNKPNRVRLENLEKKWSELLDENVCDCS